jgi:hypothetical protein
MWYRVFGSNDASVEPAGLLEYLHGQGFAVRGNFRGDDQGWFAADVQVEDQMVSLERYLATEEGIRADLNSWAAWLETVTENPHSRPLMQQVIGTRQLFTLHSPDDDPDEAEVRPLCLTLCRFLARETAGFYQVDNEGFFAADGTLLVKEA